MKKQTFVFLLLFILIVSCAKPKTNSKSDEDTTAESEVIESAVYYVSGLNQRGTTHHQASGHARLTCACTARACPTPPGYCACGCGHRRPSAPPLQPALTRPGEGRRSEIDDHEIAHHDAVHPGGLWSDALCDERCPGPARCSLLHGKPAAVHHPEVTG